MAPGVPQLLASLPSPCPQVILAALWLAGSESQPPGCQDRPVPQGQQVLVRPPTRLQRHVTRPPCPAGMNWIKEAHRCCTQCPAGETCLASTAWHGMLWHTGCFTPGGHAPCHPTVPAGTFLFAPCSSHSNNSVCTACPAGTFRAQPNTLPKCQACYECDRQGELAVCCAMPHRAVPRCMALRCALQHHSPPCGGRCAGWLMRTLLLLLAGTGLEYLLLAFTGPFFLGALAIYRKRKRLRHSTLAGSPLPMAQVATPTAGPVAMPWYQASAQVWDSSCCTQLYSPKVTEHAASTVRQSPKHQPLLREQPSGAAQPGGQVEPSAPLEPRGALLHGSQLYTIIDAVPVRRWKEFMRVLELREAEIELVELEVAHIRDQQYEMLKRWCQQTSATLDRVYAALERMELAGCAEALRRSLLAGP
uniref:TNF receptor superfamily member 25 n=1 Tax=Falco tinnunculus TaxID=100819 RepID=A0A8C4UYT5_FALTI